MLLRRHLIALLAGLMATCSAHAAPVEISGVKLEESIQLGGATLPLNGAGLYLGKKVATPDEAFAASGPKRISITLLRELDANEFGQAFTRGLEDNTPREELGRLATSLAKMTQIFADQKRLLPGENFTVDWIPGTGTVISVKGKAQGEPFREPEFFNALLRIWLGPQPADSKLKEALLGRSA